MKIVINKDYGSFGLSCRALKRYGELTGKRFFYYHYSAKKDMWIKSKSLGSKDLVTTNDLGQEVDRIEFEIKAAIFYQSEIERTDPNLIKIIEEMGGEEAGDFDSDLVIIEIPDDVNWCIEEFDGKEWILEILRVWGR